MLTEVVIEDGRFKSSIYKLLHLYMYILNKM